MISSIIFCIIKFYSAVSAVAPPIDAPSAAHCSDTVGPASNPIAPPIYAPTVEPMLLLSDAVPLSPDAMSVNTQEQTYMKYKILTAMKMKMM